MVTKINCRATFGYALFITVEFICFHSATIFAGVELASRTVFSSYALVLLAVQLMVFVAASLFRRPPSNKLRDALLLAATVLPMVGLGLLQLAAVAGGQLDWQGGSAVGAAATAGGPPADDLLAAGPPADGLPSAGPPAAIIALAVCLGLANALLNLLWARVFSGFALKLLYRQVILSYLLGLGIYLLVTLLPNFMVVPMVACMFLGSSVLLYLESRALPPQPVQSQPQPPQQPPVQPQPVQAQQDLYVENVRRASDDKAASGPRPAQPQPQSPASPTRSAIRQLWRPVLCTAVFGFMSGLMSQISGQGELPLASFQQVSIIASLIVVGILLLPALLFSRQLSITSAYSLALPLSAAGFMLLPFIWNGFFGVTNALVNMGLMTVSIILWCMLANIAAKSPLPVHCVFGSCLMLTIAANLLGMGSGFIFAGYLTQSFLTLAGVALAAIYILSMVSLFVFRGQRAARGRQEQGDGVKQLVLNEEQYLRCCAAVGEAAGFTPRELDMLPLLARGRSIASASATLCISENTAKTHIRSIYSKLEVHSKQELIDLITRQLDEGL